MSSMNRIVFSSPFLRRRAVISALLLITVAIYANTFFNQWTYDDLPVLVNNPDAHSLSGFMENHRPGRPLRELSYIPEYQLFGENPAGYHVQQIFWHCANGCLLYAVFELLGLSPLYAALGVLLFLVHPLQSESVANISHRKELLALFFSLSAFWAYLKAVRQPGTGRLLLCLLALACYALALLANETASTLPLLLPLYDVLFLAGKERLIFKRPFLFVAGLSAAVGCLIYLSRWLFDPVLLLNIYSKNSFIASKSYLPLWLADLKVFGFYLYKIVLPFNLAPEYNVTFSERLFQPWAWCGALVLAGMLWYAFRAREKMPLVAFGIGWFCLFYLPVSNVLPVSYMLADRYMYLCLPGVALVVAFLIQKADSRRLTAFCFLVVVVLSVLVVQQNSYWKDEHTLWRHAVKVNPDSTWVQETVALSYLLSHDFNKARWHAQQALRLNRYNVRAYLTLAKSEDRLGNLEEALLNYKLFEKFGVFEYSQEVEKVSTYLPYLERRIERESINAADRNSGIAIQRKAQ